MGRKEAIEACRFLLFLPAVGGEAGRIFRLLRACRWIALARVRDLFGSCMVFVSDSFTLNITDRVKWKYLPSVGRMFFSIPSRSLYFSSVQRLSYKKVVAC